MGGGEWGLQKRTIGEGIRTVVASGIEPWVLAGFLDVDEIGELYRRSGWFQA